MSLATVAETLGSHPSISPVSLGATRAPARARTQKSGSSTTSARWTPASSGSASVLPPARPLMLRFAHLSRLVDDGRGRCSSQRSRSWASPRPSRPPLPYRLVDEREPRRSLLRFVRAARPPMNARPRLLGLQKSRWLPGSWRGRADSAACKRPADCRSGCRGVSPRASSREQHQRQVGALLVLSESCHARAPVVVVKAGRGRTPRESRRTEASASAGD